MRRSRPLLGTFVEITVADCGENRARRAISAAFGTVAEVQRRMSFHDPASVLSEVNRRAFYEPVEVDVATFSVLECAEEMWRVSGGAFDVAVAPQLQALGFLPCGGSPVNADLNSVPSFSDVELLSDRRVRFHRPGVRLDLGGIAKGFAVDRAIETLREHGIGNALVNAGGDLRGLGSRSFPIAIRNPLEPRQALTTIALADAALATSAHYFADRITPAATRGPIVEPCSYAPVAVQSATVRARTAMLADALTKIVMLRGEASLPVLVHFHADALFVVTAGEVLCSPRWA